MNFPDTFDPRIYRPAAIHDNINVKRIEDYRRAGAEKRRQKFLPKSLDNPVPPGTRGLFPFPMHLLYTHIYISPPPLFYIPSLYKSFRVIFATVLNIDFVKTWGEKSTLLLLLPPSRVLAIRCFERTRPIYFSVQRSRVPSSPDIDQSFGINISFPRRTNRNNFKQIEIPFEKRSPFSSTRPTISNRPRPSLKHFHIRVSSLYPP